MKKGNPQKKMTWEDRFIKNYACSAKNHPEKWHWCKRKNRKLFRTKMKENLKKEILDT